MLWEHGVAGSSPVFPTRKLAAMISFHLPGTQEVVGSNPTPTTRQIYKWWGSSAGRAFSKQQRFPVWFAHTNQKWAESGCGAIG